MQRPSTSSGIAATIEPQVLEDLGTAVSLLKRLARTHMPKEDLKHVLTADQLRACKVRIPAHPVPRTGCASSLGGTCALSKCSDT